MQIYEVGKTGDATRESVSGSASVFSWNGDQAYIVVSKHPFSVRGGMHNNNSISGVFCSNFSDGESWEGYSFRVVLAK